MEKIYEIKCGDYTVKVNPSGDVTADFYFDSIEFLKELPQ